MDSKNDTLAQVTAQDRSTSLVTIPSPSPNPPQRSWMRYRYIGLGAALVGLFLAALWWGLNGSGGSPPITVETLKAGPIERVLAVSGRTDTDVQAEIKSQVGARVSEIKVKEGDIVSAGQELLILDDSQQASIVRQTKAALDSAILKQESAAADLNRASNLEGTVSVVAIERAERDLALATVEVNRQQAVLDQAQLALPNYRITAPIDGIVLSQSVEKGDLVSASTVLMRIANTENLNIVVQIDEAYADKIRIGQPVRLKLTGQTETTTGIVSFVSAEVDELTGSLRVKLAFDAVPEVQIGLTAVANILVDTVENAVTVPRSALVSSGSDTAIFVLRDGHASLTPITIIDWPADRVEVVSGLADGNRIILAPDGIEDGQPFTAQDPTTASD